MDRYFVGSIAPVPESLMRTTTFIRERTEPEAAFLAVGEEARYVAALGGRRVLYDGYLALPPISKSAIDCSTRCWPRTTVRPLAL